MKLTLFAILLAAAPATAQEGGGLRGAVTFYAVGAAADLGSTAYSMHYGAHETNPTIAWMQDRTGAPVMLATSTAADAAAVYLWTRWMGKKHPRLAKVGLYAAGTVRMMIAAQNVQRGNEYRRCYALRDRACR